MYILFILYIYHYITIYQYVYIHCIVYQYVLYHYIYQYVYIITSLYITIGVYIYIQCIVLWHIHAYPCVPLILTMCTSVKTLVWNVSAAFLPQIRTALGLHFSREPSSLTPRYCTKPWFLLERKKNGSDMFHVHNQHFQKSLEKKELVTNARQLLHDCSADSARFHPPSLYMSLTDRYSHAYIYIYIVYIFICAYMYIANSGAVRCTQRSMCSTT